MRVDRIQTADVLEVLKPIWLSKPETASRLRGRIDKVLNAAQAKGERMGDNPARWRGHVDHLLPKQPKLARGHHVALSYRDVPAFMGKLREREGIAAFAFEFASLSLLALVKCLGHAGQRWIWKRRSGRYRRSA